MAGVRSRGREVRRWEGGSWEVGKWSGGRGWGGRCGESWQTARIESGGRFLHGVCLRSAIVLSHSPHYRHWGLELPLCKPRSSYSHLHLSKSPEYHCLSLGRIQKMSLVLSSLRPPPCVSMRSNPSSTDLKSRPLPD